jgi:hypothetical protein
MFSPITARAAATCARRRGTITTHNTPPKRNEPLMIEHLSASTTFVALHHSSVSHAHSHGGGLGGGSLAHTFVHSAVSAFAWQGVRELFHSAHGLGLVILVVMIIAVAIYFISRRRVRT